MHWSCYVLAAVWWKLFELPLSEPPGVHLVNRQDDSLLPGGKWVPMRSSLGPTPDGPSEAPWSITQQAAMFSERAVNLLPPSARLPECQTHFSFLCPLSAFFPFPGSLLYSNNWAAFIPTRLPVQLLNRDIKSGATISLWPPSQSPLSASVHLPSEVTMGHHHDSSVSVQWHDIHGTLSTVGQLAWSSVYRPFFPAPLSRWSLDPARSTWHTFKMATSRGFYSSSRIQSLFSLLFLPLCWVIQSLVREGR